MSFSPKAFRDWSCPVQLVARQLGHADGTLVLKVFGKFAPSGDERAKWEAVASAIDAAKKEEEKQKSGVSRGVRKTKKAGKPK